MSHAQQSHQPAREGPALWKFGFLLGASFALSMFTSACFDAPDGAVTFACDLIAAPACPEGYACQSDGCCHEIGSDVESNQGSCRLGGEEGMGDTGTSDTGTSDTGTSDTGG